MNWFVFLIDCCWSLFLPGKGEPDEGRVYAAIARVAAIAALIAFAAYIAWQWWAES